MGAIGDGKSKWETQDLTPFLGINGKETELAALAEYLESPVFREVDFDGEKLTEIIQLAGEDGFVLQPKIYAVLKVLITLDALGRQHIGDDFSVGSLLLELAAELPEELAPVPVTPELADDLRWFSDKPKSLVE